MKIRIKEEELSGKMAADVLKCVVELSNEILYYFASHKEAQQAMMTIVGLTTETILHQLSNAAELDYDEESKRYRKALGYWHDDVKRILNDPKAN